MEKQNIEPTEDQQTDNPESKLDCIENENINKRCDLNDYVKIT